MPGKFHSVKLIEDECEGCTNCIQNCPTEAIRVRDGKAQIFEERCIDCGECIRHCPNQVKTAVTDDLKALGRFQYNVAIPAPAFFGQFDQGVTADDILAGLLNVGFDDVFEVAVGAEAVTLAIRRYIEGAACRSPLISSACPAIVRLIQIRFPDLLDQIIPIHTPMDMAARLAKRKVADERDLALEDIGVFFVSPCPAKVTAVKEPLGTSETDVDGAIGVGEIYGQVRSKTGRGEEKNLSRASGLGAQWGFSGGENQAINSGVLLAVDGIQSAISVLDGVEKGELQSVDYIECQACIGGCVGGALMVQNPFLARSRVERMVEQMDPGKRYEPSVDMAEATQLFDRGEFDLTEPILARPAMRLDEDVNVAMDKMARLDELSEELPGYDCGSCGAPTCRALAEDIVQGLSVRTDCIFELREEVSTLAEQISTIVQRRMPMMSTEEERKVFDELTLSHVADELELRAAACEDVLDSRVIRGAYCSDLLSDVMANAGEGSLWITIQTHQNIVAVALMVSLGAIVVCGGREPSPGTVVRAEEENIPLLIAEDDSYTVAAKLHSLTM